MNIDNLNNNEQHDRYLINILVCFCQYRHAIKLICLIINTFKYLLTAYSDIMHMYEIFC